MKHLPIIVPELGVPSAKLSLWFVAEGEPVEAGERLVEIRAGAATFDIVSASNGCLFKRVSFPGESLAAGQTLGYIVEDVDG